MATLESLGLGSGVLSSDLIDKIITAERSSVDLRLDRREELAEAKITAYGEIKSKMAQIQSAAITLSSPTLTGATKVTSSDESILTATGSAAADPGNYNVEVLNVAKSHSLATGTYGGYDEVVGSGKLVFSFGKLTYDGSGNVTGQDPNIKAPSKTLEIDSSNNTLAGIRDAINNAEMGVNATIVNDGTGYRLQIVSAETGEENAMTISAQDANGNPTTGALSSLAYNENQNGLTQTSKAENAELRVNGLGITRASNQIDEVIKGVTLNLNSANAGQNIRINVSADAELLTETIQGFVDAYNELKEFVDDLSKFDTKNQVGGLLMGDSAVRGMMEQLRSMISQPIVGLNGKFRALTELGINTNKDNKYLLDFNVSKLEKALNESRSDVVNLLSKTGNASDAQIQYMNDSVNTKPGQYDVNITQLATQAKYQGGSLSLLEFSSPVVLDSSNNKFTINVNGVSADVELKQGSYSTGEDLAKQIAMQINSAESLQKNNHTVSVSYDAGNNRFEVTSNAYGSKSQIAFTNVNSNTANTLGFSATGSGTYQGVGLKTLNAETFAGKGAHTLPGGVGVDKSQGINFAANNATFSLSVDGAAAVQVTLNQNAQSTDLNGDGVYDRKDTLQSIQNAIDATTLSGQVTASFDNNGHLIFTTNAVGANKSIEITQVGSSSTDNLLGLKATQGAQTNGAAAGLVLGSAVEFKVQVDGLESATKVSVPAGTYATGAELATAIQNALAHTLTNDAAFTNTVTGASTTTGSRDISEVDFSANNAGFRLNVGGVEHEVIANSGTGIAGIQAALDAKFGANQVIASLDNNRLKMTTFDTGHEQYIEVKSDGRGAQSSPFADISTDIDFSGANNATFDLTVDGVTFKVDVNGDATKGSNDASSNLNVIQSAIDYALTNSGQFAAGDVVAKVNDSDELYFETLSKNGVRTASTFGSNASIQISNIAGAGNTDLGLTAETQTTGYDTLGLTIGERSFGYDLTPQVEYQYDANGDVGSFKINIGGNATKVGFTELDSSAISFLGLQDASVYQPKIAQGQDVKGTIDGVEAKGEGQFLRAQDGNSKASNGFYIGNTATDFSTAVTINNSNNKFKISIDGVEAEVTLANGTYNSGTTLATALEKAINDTAEFKAKNLAVKVDFTTDENAFSFNKFGIISASTGATSEVKITEASQGVTDIFGFVLGRGDGEAGKAQQGEQSGASGIRLRVTGGALGSRGTVGFVSGFGDQLKKIMDTFLNSSKSIVAGREQGLDRELENVVYGHERLNEWIAAQ